MKKAGLFLIIVLLCFGCKTKNDQVETQKKVENVQETKTELKHENTVVETKTETQNPNNENQIVTENNIEQNQVIEDPKNKIDERMTFKLEDKMSEDVLKNHMKNLFTAIEEKISQGDFESWFNSISKNYRDWINNKDVLKKMSSQSYMLSNRGIVLEHPKDYFEYVVIQAREGRVLKFYDYKFIDKFHVKVICLLDDKNKFEYNFIYEDNSWKLDR